MPPLLQLGGPEMISETSWKVWEEAKGKRMQLCGTPHLKRPECQPGTLLMYPLLESDSPEGAELQENGAPQALTDLGEHIGP